MTAPVETSDFASGAGKSLVSRLGAVIEVAAQPIYTWLFTVATYGLYMVLWSAISILSQLCDFGQTAVLQRVVPQARDQAQACSYVKAALLLSTGTSTLAALVIVMLAPWLAAALNVAPRDQESLVSAIRIVAWTLPLWTFIEVATAAMRARRAFGPEIRLKVFYEQVSRLGIALICFAAGMTSLGLVTAHLISLIIVTGLAVRLLGRYYPLAALWRAPLSQDVWQPLLVYGGAFAPASLIRRAITDIPPILLNLVLPGAAGAVAAGLYSIARKVSSVLAMVRLSFGYVMAPLASAQAATRDVRAIQPIYGFATRLAAVAVLPLAATLIALTQPILGLFAPEARAAGTVLVILVVGRCLEALAGPGQAILDVVGKASFPTLNGLAGLAVVVAAGLALGSSHGAAGMAVAVGLSLNAMAYLAMGQLVRDHDIHPFAAPFGRALLIGLLAGAGLLATGQLDVPGPLWVGGVLTLSLFPAGLWLALRYGLTDSDRRNLGAFSRRLKLV